MTTETPVAALVVSAPASSLSPEALKAVETLRAQGQTHILAPEADATAAVEAVVQAVALAQAATDSIPRVKRKYTKRVQPVKAAKPKAAKKPQKKAKLAAKKAAPKTKKAAPKKAKPTTGQSGPRIKDLVWEDLNKKEKLLLGCFEIKGARETRTIEQLGAEAFKSQSAVKSYSWARNSLRRLIRGRLIEKLAPGQYRLAAHTRALIANR